jgi:hypothetical protein
LIDFGFAGQAIEQRRCDAELDSAAPAGLNHHIEELFTGNVRI